MDTEYQLLQCLKKNDDLEKANKDKQQEFKLLELRNQGLKKEIKKLENNNKDLQKEVDELRENKISSKQFNEMQE